MITINGVPFGEILFPNGEAVFKVINSDFPLFEIYMQFESNKDIGDAMFAVEYIQANYNPVRIILIIPALPYARMDRQINDQMFSLQYFGNILNKMGFYKVYCCDPHSGVSKNLIKNLFDRYLDDIKPLVIQSMMDCGAEFIHLPDKGAKTKYSELLKGIKATIISGEKERDPLNKGRIIGMDIDLSTTKKSIKGKTILIVDDICVRGGTFDMAAERLLAAGAEKVCLFITHCEDAIFEGNILKGNKISKVYTTDSIKRRRDTYRNKLVVYKIWKGDYMRVENSV